MAHEIEIFSALCSTKKFKINGINADSCDFGSQGDNDTEDAEAYCCGDMQFKPEAPKAGVLEKYKIDDLEYWTIANKLQEELSFGSCGLCS